MGGAGLCRLCTCFAANLGGCPFGRLAASPMRRTLPITALRVKRPSSCRAISVEEYPPSCICRTTFSSASVQSVALRHAPDRPRPRHLPFMDSMVCSPCRQTCISAALLPSRRMRAMVSMSCGEKRLYGIRVRVVTSGAKINHFLLDILSAIVSNRGCAVFLQCAAQTERRRQASPSFNGPRVNEPPAGVV